MHRSMTKHLVSDNGERLKIIVNKESGLPLFYPNLYITSQIRGSSKSVATIQSFIISIKVLVSWCDEYDIDIESRFELNDWLKVQEIDSLRDHCSLILKSSEYEKNKVTGLKRSHSDLRSVSSATKYIRMTFIADYINWLAEILSIPSSNDNHRSAIDVMQKRIKTHRPKKKGRSETAREDKGLDSRVLMEVLEVSKPYNDKNPYFGYELQVRNALVIALLHYLGIRRGELLNLRVEDINFITNEIRIIRRADSNLDQRVHQPLVKTEERVLPISDKLAERLTEYVTSIRSKYPLAKKHPYLFVTHKSGPYLGKPLSNSGFGKLMRTLQSVADDFSKVHAHAFRHSWNYSFSKILDQSKNNESPEKEEQMRSYLMGWKDTSGTAAIYNRRHIKEKAKEAILDFQNKIVSIDGSSDD